MIADIDKRDETQNHLGHRPVVVETILLRLIERGSTVHCGGTIPLARNLDYIRRKLTKYQHSLLSSSQLWIQYNQLPQAPAATTSPPRRTESWEYEPKQSLFPLSHIFFFREFYH